MKILFVAMTDSVHAARWISQLANSDWDLHLFPSVDSGLVHADLRSVRVHVPMYGRRHPDPSVRVRGIPLFNDFFASSASFALSRLSGFHEWKVRRLAALIERIKPDVVHSLEIQHAGYLTMEAKRRMADSFPRWIVSNWGSDIYLFGRLRDHERKIREVLESCDFYACECRRDLALAQRFGLRGRPLPILPNGGGFDLDAAARLRSDGPTSRRRTIMLKGYQNWAGRALVALRALERCAELLRGYELVIHSPSPDVELAAQLFAAATGISVRLLPLRSAHGEILRHHGQARVSIGLSIGDGISTSLLEAMVMGSFPIQSRTACADEWIVDGETGILTAAEEPAEVEAALRRALTDDALVDAAAERNLRVATERLDKGAIQKAVLRAYDIVLHTPRNDAYGDR